jgi:hypothetical protein
MTAMRATSSTYYRPAEQKEHGFGVDQHAHAPLLHHRVVRTGALAEFYRPTLRASRSGMHEQGRRSDEIIKRCST